MTGVLPLGGTALETQRLVLRAMSPEDVESLLAVWGDAQTMLYYPKPYTRAEVVELIERQRRRYVDDGHGLWAAVLKSSGEVIGDCGLVRQQVEGRRGDEIVEVRITVPMPRDERSKEILRELAKLNPEDPRAELWKKIE